MHFAYILLFATVALARPAKSAKPKPTTIGGSPAWCTDDKAGLYRPNRQKTKHCCTTVKRKAHYNSTYVECMGHEGLGSGTKDIDYVGFAKCCKKDGGSGGTVVWSDGSVTGGG
ncbi:hypothetical protein EJ06DRAFT_522326 [Trichodelitschia bisporula]|uniref:Uncharacterized protein n=1 Tax=Trichodelitschia bisporula TaxID=703511 RepID=A0A6G1HU69_9PEZI|nr:hypothetical protein EJ06DRAFT_522326 [Trichodelitschia bisporula]